MSDHVTDSLLFVCENAVSDMHALSAAIRTAEPRQLEGLLNKLAKVADLLSSGLHKLSNHAAEIPQDVPDTPAGPPATPPLYKLGMERLALVHERGLCACGKINRAENAAPVLPDQEGPQIIEARASARNAAEE